MSFVASVTFALVASFALSDAKPQTFNIQGNIKIESSLDDAPIAVQPFISDSLLGKYHKAAIATDNVLCSEIARDVLIKRGNAVDASVAALFCIGVMNAHSAGLGGGHFSTIYLRESKKCIYIDARETAPASAHRDMYLDNPKESVRGWRAIAVPGELLGARTAFQKYGSRRVSWADLLQPTIDLLVNGYPLSPAVAEVLKKYSSIRKRVNDPDHALHVYYNHARNRAYRAGEIVKQPILASTLRELQHAINPIRTFYNGVITQKLVEEFQENGGELTAEDFSTYATRITTSNFTEMHHIDEDDQLIACAQPLPSGTPVTMGIIKSMRQLGVTPKDFADDVNFLHNFIESGKYAYAIRQNLADPQFNSSAEKAAKFLTSNEFARAVANKIDAAAHRTLPNLEEYNTLYADAAPEIQSTPDNHGTSHMSIVDEDGNAVSLTSTINHYFGSKVGSLSTGIIWNNEMDDFSQPSRDNSFDYAPSEPNFIKPGKRPLSSMSPLIFVDKPTGNVRLVIGASGGSRIITGTAIAAIRALWGNVTMKEAIDAPRVHDQLIPHKTLYEDRIDERVAQELDDRGHNMKKYRGRFSVVQGVMAAEDELTANCDYRKGPASQPAGF